MEIDDITEFVREVYQTNDFIPLHEPKFVGNEKNYIIETIDSTYVSSVGKFVDEFEQKIQEYTGSTAAVATVNGTAGLHVSLKLAGVDEGDLVITQALTFVATCNAIKYVGADPIFCDVSEASLGLCPSSVEEFLKQHADVDAKGCYYRKTGQRITALLPVHTFGHPVELDELMGLSKDWSIPLIEDAAESLGSLYKDRHTGTVGDYGVISFNGNKIITTGGGGVLLSQTEVSGSHAKHLTTTAKVPHAYEYFHDELAFNYRMPNINAALGCAQLENLDEFIEKKRKIAGLYNDFFEGTEFEFVQEPTYSRSNYWLNAILCPDRDSRETLLKRTNDSGVMTRPAWKLMTSLPMYSKSIRSSLHKSKKIEETLVNLPSSVI